jgi:NAD(P) transhydrogenase subunit alpha
MIIGIPKEIMHEEKRVAATPNDVKKYVADGHKVLVEMGAGVGALHADADYAAAGAEMVKSAQELYDRAELILKVKEPQFNENFKKHEVEMMHKGQYLITFIHPAAPVNHEMVKKMAAAGVISLTMDCVPRISRAQSMDALTSMSTCAGYKGMLMAASYMTKFVPMVGTAVGVLKPANVVVIGTGVAGLQSVATAKRLGAVVTAIDIRPAAAEQARSLGAKTLETGVPAEFAIGEGGYALQLPAEWLEKERAAIYDTIVAADVVICSALIPGELAPVIVTEEMVKAMNPGSVIVDIAIDQGGNCALTRAGEEFRTENGVLVSGVKNIPGMMPTASTWMFAQNIYNLLAYLAKDGKIVLDREDPIVASSLTTINKEIVHAGAKKAGL